MIKITFPDDSIKEFAPGTSGSDIAASVSEGLRRSAVAYKLNEKIYDLDTPLAGDGRVEILTLQSSLGLSVLRHSCAHVMALAVKKLFPDAQVAIGPSIANGFYYDFDKAPIKEEDFPRLEQEMKTIIKNKLPFVKIVSSREKALSLFKNEPYKQQLINELPENEEISLYKLNGFTDLCRGPHLPHAGYIKAFKLQRLAGAYWRGDENNRMLTRLYGTAFADKKALKNYLAMMAEAEKRDHRKLGTKLDLFSISDEIGGGLVLWHPKGAALKNVVETFWRKDHLLNGYELVSTPHIGKSRLWQTSGHLDFFKENMFAPNSIDEKEYYLKPMNCPFHINIYKSRKWSYRDLPLRWAELGTVYRYEKSGVLHGLMRVRGFTQDDAHIICTPDQMQQEIKQVLNYCLKMLGVFGFKDFTVYVSTRPAQKAVGDPSLWQEATAALRSAVAATGQNYEIDAGGGAFYGPKIDVKIKDAIGRQWQCSTIQFDFNLPQRFDLTYTDPNSEPARPYMIHRALFGSIERFLGVLIEHYAGKFPFWLAPEQIRILTISRTVNDYADSLYSAVLNKGLRPAKDFRSESLGKKVRDAQIAYIPVILTIGEKEAENNTVSLRTLDGKVLNGLSRESFLEQSTELDRARALQTVFN